MAEQTIPLLAPTEGLVLVLSLISGGSQECLIPALGNLLST